MSLDDGRERVSGGRWAEGIAGGVIGITGLLLIKKPEAVISSNETITSIAHEIGDANVPYVGALLALIGAALLAHASGRK